MRCYIISKLAKYTANAMVSAINFVLPYYVMTYFYKHIISGPSLITIKI